MTALLAPPPGPAPATPAAPPAADLTVDQVTLTVIDNYLATTCREMGVAMMRTAYSPMFNEALDFSCVLFDAAGRMIAQAEFCPSQIGTIKFTIEWMLDELGPNVYRPGDVIIMNDPYRGSGHIPEHTLLKAVFHGEEIVGFVANCAHLAEPGAKAPGGLAGDATDIFQEGLRLPPLWLQREGVPQEDIWKLIFANHRTPKVTYGDLMAMVGSLNVAERRLKSLLGTYGHETVTTATEDLIKIAERRMSEEIRRIPDGEYRFSDIIEDDGVAEGSYVVECTVVVDGEGVTCDFTGSSGQAAGPMNGTYAVTASSVYNAFMHITDPTIPRNEGCYRPINVIAPPGTILNCKFPAPLVGGNTELSPRITDIIFGALADALPERIPASHGGTVCCFLFGGEHPETGDLYSHFHFEGVGWGGRPIGDGDSQVIVIIGNARNTPVEIFETRYPVRVESYRLLEDSGGPGLNRGGLGAERILTIEVDEVTVSALFNRMLVDPFGIHGGKPGANSGIYVRLAGEESWSTFRQKFGTMSPSKFSNILLHRGDQVKILAPGGGGWGDPLARPADRVLADVAEGLVTPEGARRDYGLAVERRNGAWDATPTPARVAAGSTTLVGSGMRAPAHPQIVEVSP